jgi:cytoskeletal protein CcmA (bactofilin family)
MGRFRSQTFYRPPDRPGPDIIVVPPSETSPAEGRASREATPQGELRGTMSCLDGSTRLDGSLIYRGPGRIDGEVEGAVSADDTLVIGATAVVVARVEGASIVVAGRVTGDITARSRLELQAGARVVGNIWTPRLVIAAGAFLDGDCTMSATAADHREPSSAGNEPSQGS